MSNHKPLKQMIGLAVVMVILVGCSGGTPTYSQILNTYPNGTKLCQTVVTIKEVTADGSWILKGSFYYQGGPMYVCYGTKITANVPVEIEDKTFELGTKLTVDKNLEWVEVSSWD
jgi:hypothetical protein